MPRRDAGGGGWLRLWPLAALLAALGLALAFGLHRQLTMESLAASHQALTEFVGRQPVLAAVGYVAAYVAIIACSIPVGPVLTMTGGLMFGIWIGSALAVLAGTAGASVLFLAVRSALAPMLARRAGRLLDRVRPGLERDGFWYLLSLRLLPIVPYWLGSMAPGLVGMRLPVFVAATALGILPGTVVFAGIGAGLAEVFARGGQPRGADLLTPGVLLPLAGLAMLSLLAAYWRRRRRGEPGVAGG
jgi:uncharacterized membrane protein YdjX (TVP38/TMEM64 family)